jgi:hypothetical protein
MFHTTGKYWSHEEPTDTGCMVSGDNTAKNTKFRITGFHDNEVLDFGCFQVMIPCSGFPP